MFRMLFIAAALLLATPAQAEDIMFDFENGSKDGWSKAKFLELDDTTVLGPFNSRNKKYPRRVRLKLDGQPAAGRTLSFDLVTIGKWEESGDLADKFTLEAGGEELLTVTNFPCGFVDADENVPAGTPNSVRIGRRHIKYCVLPQNVTIPASAVDNGELKLEFSAKVSGRKSEFWALDNVRIH